MMTFENRMAVILAAVRTMLERYTPPKAFTEEHQIAELRAISQALNSRLPSTDEASFHALLAEVLQIVGENARTRAWPTTGEFVAGWEAIQAKRRAAAQTETVASDELTPADQHAVERLMEGLSKGTAYRWLANEKRMAEMERRGANLWDMETIGLPLTRGQQRRLRDLPRSPMARQRQVSAWAKVWGVGEDEARHKLRERHDRETGNRVGQVKQMAKVSA